MPDDKTLNLWVNTIIYHGTHTGSRIYGVCTDDSDWDYVMDVATVRSCLRSIGIADSGEDAAINWENAEKYFRGSRFMSFKYRNNQGITVNLIVVPDDLDVAAWRHATGYLESHDPIADKKIRCSVFESKMNEWYVQAGCPGRQIEKEKVS